MVSDVPVDDEALVVTSGIFRLAGAQSFGGAYRGRVCVRVFIGWVCVRVFIGCECACVLWASSLYCVILKKVLFALKLMEISTVSSTLDLTEHCLFSQRQYCSVNDCRELVFLSSIVDLIREVIKFLQHV